MANVLRSEWEERLALEAKANGAKTTPRNGGRASWESRLGGVRISITLTTTPGLERYLVPEARLGGSATLDANPAIALVDMQDRIETIHSALRAYTPLAHLRVWLQDCPCDWCSEGRGRKDCDHCHGTGVRQEET